MFKRFPTSKFSAHEVSSPKTSTPKNNSSKKCPSSKTLMLRKNTIVSFRHKKGEKWYTVGTFMLRKNTIVSKGMFGWLLYFTTSCLSHITVW
jgi:hypothetical protein